MEKTDFKKLDVERAQIAVSVQKARDLVAKMLGSGSDTSEEDVPVVAAASSVAGLGYRNEGPAQPSQTKALERLKKAHENTVTKLNSQSMKQESDSEEESRTSSVRNHKRGMSTLDSYRIKKKRS